jgi:hypothetical protein
VRHQHQGRAQRTDDAEHERHHLFGRALVEIARRLVSQQHRRTVDQGAGERDPLAFAAGKLRGQMVRPGGETDLSEQLVGAGLRLGHRNPGDAGGQRDVLQRGQLGHQLVVLEDEADPAAQGGAGTDGTETGGEHRDLAGVGQVKPAEDLQQRRLARARGTADGDRLPGKHGERDALEHGERTGGGREGLGEAAGAEDGFRHRAWPPKVCGRRPRARARGRRRRS